MKEKFYDFVGPLSEFLAIIVSIAGLIFAGIRYAATLGKEWMVMQYRIAEETARQETLRLKQQAVLEYVFKNLDKMSPDERKLVFEGFSADQNIRSLENPSVVGSGQS